MAKLYVKEKVIGSGSFGNVWLVKSKVSNSYYVMKELNLSSKNAEEIQQSMVEVTVLSRCRHRNIIRYKDAIIDHKSGMLSIIMEYADGGDLHSAITNQANVPFKEHNVLSWFTQICLALQYIHHKSILHRDLKTKNIFLTREKQIKLGDFGIARCLMETNELATTAIGTPYYLSPEICHRQPYNHKSDIWALGCVLFEIAALSYPFQACNFAQLVTLIVTGKRKELPSYCSSVVRDLVNLLLVENPEERPSADDILDLPCLQPYLSELWEMQNNATTSADKILNDKKSIRRHYSLNYSAKLANKPEERRASISIVEQRINKKRFGFSNKLKSISGQKLVGPQVLPVKELKIPTVKNSQKTDWFSTYKVLKPFSSKKTKTTTNRSHIPLLENVSRKQTKEKSNKNDDSDRGYQSEDATKHLLKKLTVSETTQSTAMSTTKFGDSLVSELDAFIISDEVFDDLSQKKGADKPDTSSECPHSHCQKCMLDMLWKNRIRDSPKPLIRSDERLELIRKLKVVYGEDLFHKVYREMISNWESSETNIVPKSLNDVTSSLNYSQLQHIPLMMQLIQLNLMPI